MKLSCQKQFQKLSNFTYFINTISRKYEWNHSTIGLKAQFLKSNLVFIVSFSNSCWFDSRILITTNRIKEIIICFKCKISSIDLRCRADSLKAVSFLRQSFNKFCYLFFRYSYRHMKPLFSPFMKLNRPFQDSIALLKSTAMPLPICMLNTTCKSFQMRYCIIF